MIINTKVKQIVKMMMDFEEYVLSLHIIIRNKFMIRHYIDNFIIRNQHYIISGVWLALITLFTYTSLIHFALRISGIPFFHEYCSNQQYGISLFVNLGLLSMVMFDYIGMGEKITAKMVVLILFAVFLIFGIYLHANIYIAQKLQDYICPINSNYLSIVLHLLFYVILYYIKVKSIEPCIGNDVVKEEY